MFLSALFFRTVALLTLTVVIFILESAFVHAYFQAILNAVIHSLVLFVSGTLDFFSVSTIFSRSLLVCILLLMAVAEALVSIALAHVADVK